MISKRKSSILEAKGSLLFVSLLISCLTSSCFLPKPKMISGEFESTIILNSQSLDTPAEEERLIENLYNRLSTYGYGATQFYVKSVDRGLEVHVGMVDDTAKLKELLLTPGSLAVSEVVATVEAVNLIREMESQFDDSIAVCLDSKEDLNTLVEQPVDANEPSQHGPFLSKFHVDGDQLTLTNPADSACANRFIDHPQITDLLKGEMKFVRLMRDNSYRLVVLKEPSTVLSPFLTKANTYVSPEQSLTIELDAEGAKLFADLTHRNLNKPLALILDDMVLSTPILKSPITEGKLAISGHRYDDFEIKLIAINNSGLPEDLVVVSQEHNKL